MKEKYKGKYNSYPLFIQAASDGNVEDVRILLESMEKNDLDGVILGSSCSDTIKEVNEKDLSIKRTLDRKKIWNSH